MHDQGQGHEDHPPDLFQAAFSDGSLRMIRTSPRDLITLPVRIGWWATRFGFHVAGKAVTAALRATERLAEAAVPAQRRLGATVDPEESGGVPVAVVVIEPAPVYETPSAPPRAPPVRRPTTDLVAPAHVSEEVKQTPPTPTPTARTPTREPAAPTHVSEDVELVESFAEPGAEDGVGATVHVEEPWKGYRQMTAKDVIARLADASREELAAAELYEHAHRGRQTVLLAADRQLRGATAAAARQRK